ncbi:MAG TPA: DNA (cytosine-5-)-methyltransferase, partial [Actinobacteria bacterium]|nr:DNA (cytosine-5-)-methyltransferase [Actinomycetota bacterium]
MITVNSYFSGAGLFDIGFREAGIKINQSFEIDDICCKTQRANFDHEIIQIDLTKKLVKQENKAPVMIGTYPCTKYSPAASIIGEQSGDDLFLHFFRHIAIQQPEVYIVENVPGMKKFPVVMEAMSELPDYFVSVFCPVNASIWLPQERERLILVGSRKPFSWRQPTAKKKVTLKDIMEDEPDVRIPQYVYNRMNKKGNYRDLPIISDPEKGDIAPCVVAHYAKDRGTRLIADKKFPQGAR